MPDNDPLLPRQPDDPGNLNRLRREAMQRMDAEGREPSAGSLSAATVYGGPPPPGFGNVTRRWTLKRILLLVIAMIAALTAIFFGARKVAMPVYGGPPPDPNKRPDDGPKPVYGGPPPHPPGA